MGIPIDCLESSSLPMVASAKVLFHRQGRSGKTNAELIVVSDGSTLDVQLRSCFQKGMNMNAGFAVVDLELGCKLIGVNIQL